MLLTGISASIAAKNRTGQCEDWRWANQSSSSQPLNGIGLDRRFWKKTFRTNKTVVPKVHGSVKRARLSLVGTSLSCLYHRHGPYLARAKKLELERIMWGTRMLTLDPFVDDHRAGNVREWAGCHVGKRWVIRNVALERWMHCEISKVGAT